MQALTLTTAIMLLLFSGSASAINGDGTFYDGITNDLQGTGHCSYMDNYQIPAGLTGVAYAVKAWGTADKCGACVDIHHNGKSIRAVVVDSCGSCAPNDLDLFRAGFAQLEDLSAGRMPISWDWVNCAHPGNVWIVVRPSSTVDWFQAQTTNANTATTKMEISTDGGASYATMHKNDYNFFQAPGHLNSGTVAIRATGDNGRSVVASGVYVSGGSFQANGNF